MNIHALSAVLATVVLGWAFYGFSMAGGDGVETAAPGWNGRAVNAVTVEMPPILEMAKYYPNDKNPFVPAALREIEEQVLRRPRDRVQKVVKFKPFTLPKDQPKVIEKPQFKAPRMKRPVDAPEVVGLVRLGNQIKVSITLGQQLYVLQPGEKAVGWTFVKLIGDVVVMESADGEEVRLPMPQQDYTITLGEGGGSTGGTGGGGPITIPSSDDPEVQAAIDAIKRDPSQLQRYLQDQSMRERLLKEPSVQQFLRQSGRMRR